MSRADEILQRARPFLLRPLPIEGGYDPGDPKSVPYVCGCRGSIHEMFCFVAWQEMADARRAP